MEKEQEKMEKELERALILKVTEKIKNEDEIREKYLKIFQKNGYEELTMSNITATKKGKKKWDGEQQLEELQEHYLD